MIRILVCAAASLLMAGVLYAQDKKPEGKADAVKKISPEAVKKEGKEQIKKEAPEAPKKQLKEGVQKGPAKPEAGSHKGRLTKIGVESRVVKLSVDGNEYEFPVTDNTLALLKTEERDGKPVVVGLQLMNLAGEFKKDSAKKEALQKGEQKKPGDKPVDKPKEKKPD